MSARGRLAGEVLEGYTRGLFPMADGSGRIRLYTADPRAVLPLEGFHCPRRLRRRLRCGDLEIRLDTAFAEVVRGCSERADTWISGGIAEVFEEFHRRGLAHSVEAWREGRLVGGLYGLALGGAFFGESMFHRVPDASRACVVHLVERLRERGFTLLDCQQQTPHMERFGAVLIPAGEYLRRLRSALALRRDFR